MNLRDTENQDAPLYRAIMRFRKQRKRYALSLITVGAAGLVLPVLPGIAMVSAGVVMMKPELGEKIIAAVNKYSKDSGSETP